ncbi:cell division regulator GpsB [Salipaludibacillus agaradhaerens]|uniref:Cell cycle protein GpsB n=1 Tax=Salipaludibacillus agaradhaerens TaxID=76935 RepID=A0A9Q4FYK9_SALAG|nr:cell division regulator GpsB [Salipaludibacillus agaradhaerens]MCR6096242.1 cell division regulator GpsB [Salipaludibacillus agaradhaerens]MCR6114199.1 cell division regulator GpsB [Salipaludibacillus agaradhaerens]
MDKKQVSRLTKNEIYEKDFKTSMRGYNQDEVDQFLDDIIKDYESFENRIQTLEQENERLKKETVSLSEKTRTQAPAQPTTGNTNYDILRRLSNLEKHVFGSKLYD